MLVSAVMGTGGQKGIRKPFLKQSIFYWLHQIHMERELIIVDGDEEPSAFIPGEDHRIKYIHVPGMKSLPEKLNIGIEEAEGEVILKVDDDDYYAPTFYSEVVSQVQATSLKDFIFFPSSAVVYLTRQKKLKFPGFGRFFGSGLGFSKRVWRKRPFDREHFQGSDIKFREDHQEEPQLRGYDPELLMMVRHGRGHVFHDLHGMDVDEFYAQCPVYKKSLKEVVGEHNCKFYESL